MILPSANCTTPKASKMICLWISRMGGSTARQARNTSQSRSIGPAADSRYPIIAPLTPGDEPIVVSKHTIQSAKGPLTYEARAGRLPIRNAGEGTLDEMLAGQVASQRFNVALLVSHVLSEVEQMCDRAAVLVRGKLAYLGSLSELRRGQDEAPRPLEKALEELYGAKAS